ncbi:MAG: hypothetical protein HKN25_11750 [Pyrinomonadaceae bacterium]|nr:hypothetical protein [Pyrinomonadaceae bacterium]
MKTYFVSVVLVLGYFAALPSEAVGCVCVSTPGKLSALQFQNRVTRNYNQVTAVFLGEKLRSDRYTADFKIIDVWKGDQKTTVTLSTGTRRLPGTDIESASSCDIRFRGKATKYLVFASKTKYGDLQAWQCSLTRPANMANQIIDVLNKLRKIEDVS